MKGCLSGILVCAAIGGLGILLNVTNPSQADYETFALQQMTLELCPKVPVFGKDCPRFLDENQEEVKSIVRKHTRRHDYGVFSRYETHLSLRSILPGEALPFLSMLPIATGYDLETVGVLGNFYIYQAKEKQL